MGIPEKITARQLTLCVVQRYSCLLARKYPIKDEDEAMLLLLAVAFTLPCVFQSGNAEVVGHQSLRDILTRKKCICPCGSKDDMNKFIIPFSEGNWFEAVSYCSEIGMALVKIRDTYDSKELQTWLNEYGYGYSESYWIGANDLAKPGIFRWGLTTNEIEFKQWASKQPDSSRVQGETEYCVEIRANTMQWSDSVCSKRLKFICENVVE